MCNLHSLTKGQAAIRELTPAMVDRTGNLPPMPGIFPDYPASIVRNGVEGRELALARWGMPSPTIALKGRTTDPGVTNIRNTASPHWRRWLGPANRCVVPLTSFSEYDTLPNGKKEVVWFALDESRPLAVFAGIWTSWASVRKKAEGEVTVDAYGCPDDRDRAGCRCGQHSAYSKAGGRRMFCYAEDVPADMISKRTARR